jgi:hypothetical protein
MRATEDNTAESNKPKKEKKRIKAWKEMHLDWLEMIKNQAKDNKKKAENGKKSVKPVDA